MGLVFGVCVHGCIVLSERGPSESYLLLNCDRGSITKLSTAAELIVHLETQTAQKGNRISYKKKPTGSVINKLKYSS